MGADAVFRHVAGVDLGAAVSHCNAVLLRCIVVQGEGEQDADAHDAIEEAQHRLDDLRAGRPQPILWEAARKRIFARG